MKDIIIVSIPALTTLLGLVIPSILTGSTNKKIKTLDSVKKEFEDKMEANRQEDIARHQETLDKLAELTKIVDWNDIDAVRNRIVAFENLCRLDKKYTNIKEYQYKTYFKDEDKWKMYHKKYPELNGEIDMAIENIRNHYKKYKELQEII